MQLKIIELALGNNHSHHLLIDGYHLPLRKIKLEHIHFLNAFSITL
jgi:hypothetical protein